ncbi:MAG: TonB-dependent receptor [Cyclobacteriaceae bacterium]
MRGLLITFLALFSITLFGQVDSTSTGEVVDAEIVIQKDRQIVLPVAGKLSTKPRNAIGEIPPLSLSYQPVNPEFSWPSYKSDVSFKRVDDEVPVAVYQNSIKAGYGNFQSPLLELKYFNKWENLRLQTGLFHESFGQGPVESSNSSSSQTDISVGANYKSKLIELTPQLMMARNGYKFYGNTNRLNSGFPTEDLDKVARTSLDFGIGVQGGSKDLEFFVRPAITHANQSTDNGPDVNSELGFELVGGLNLKVDKKLTAGFDIEGNTSEYKGGIEYDRSLFTIRPWISHQSTDFLIKAGFGLSSGKSSGQSSFTAFYPFIDTEWRFDPKWSISGSLGSGIEWNSLNSILGQNQFLDDSLIIQNTELAISVVGEIKGSITNNLLVSSGVKWESYNGLPFYIPSGDSSRFTLAYDNGKTNVVSFKSGITYAPSISTSVGAEVSLFNYSTKSLDRAWHLPSFSLKFFFTKNIKEKFFISTELLALSGIDAPGSTTVEIIELDSFLDVNLNLDYKATDRFSVFLKLNNLLNKEYERYVGYPVRGASFKLGAKYRF